MDIAIGVMPNTATARPSKRGVTIGLQAIMLLIFLQVRNSSFCLFRANCPRKEQTDEKPDKTFTTKKPHPKPSKIQIIPMETPTKKNPIKNPP
jgi:hypothetical protein